MKAVLEKKRESLATLYRGIAVCAALSLSVAFAWADGPLKKLTVSHEGKGDFTTIQAAVDNAPKDGAVIRILPGSYREKIKIAKDNIHLIGVGKKPQDVVVSFGDSAKNTGSTFKSGTITVEGDGFEAENLTIENTWWNEHPDPSDASQAVALHLVSDHSVLDRVRLLSGQDTLYAASRTCRTKEEASGCRASRQYFKDCFIEGHVDYIFGDSKAVFENCELHSRPRTNIMITAQSRLAPDEDSGYSFLHCSITGEDGKGKVVLGRPWRDYANVLFYDTNIVQKIDASGWSEWGGRLKTSTYREYKSHGPGVNDGQRAVISPALSAEEEKNLTVRGLLTGKDNWKPESEIKTLRKVK